MQEVQVLQPAIEKCLVNSVGRAVILLLLTKYIMRYTTKREQKNAYNNWKCKSCNEVFRTRRLLGQHRKNCHHIYNQSQGQLSTKEIYCCKFCGKEWITTKSGLGFHERYCKLNPNADHLIGHSHSEEIKKQISMSMKRAHAEGRAHNIGECRWNNEPSYPEQWLIKVLKNEFGLEKDKDYKMELPFHRFSLDFAWPEKKICIEIDGEQHERFQEQKNRDIEKDKLLKEEGWKELRKSWKEIFNSPKEFIKEVENILGRC